VLPTTGSRRQPPRALRGADSYLHWQVLLGILINNSRLNDLRAHMEARFADMRELWQSDLHRLAEAFDRAQGQ
jgi:hypothetical protein